MRMGDELTGTTVWKEGPKSPCLEPREDRPQLLCQAVSTIVLPYLLHRLGNQVL
jgi:hypothetical protein